MTRIPQVVYQIWTGGSSVPDIVHRTIDYCLDNGLSHVLFTDSDMEAIGFSFPKGTMETYKSDVFRAWVLLNHGGMYIDADTEIIGDAKRYFSLDGDNLWCKVDGNGFRRPDVMMSGKNGKYSSRILSRYLDITDERDFSRITIKEHVRLWKELLYSPYVMELPRSQNVFFDHELNSWMKDAE